MLRLEIFCFENIKHSKGAWVRCFFLLSLHHHTTVCRISNTFFFSLIFAVRFSRSRLTNIEARECDMYLKILFNIASLLHNSIHFHSQYSRLFFLFSMWSLVALSSSFALESNVLQMNSERWAYIYISRSYLHLVLSPITERAPRWDCVILKRRRRWWCEDDIRTTVNIRCFRSPLLLLLSLILWGFTTISCCGSACWRSSFFDDKFTLRVVGTDDDFDL